MKDPEDFGKKPLSVFLVNFDWRNTFSTSFIELHEKLERDRWNADLNDFFFFSWAYVDYEKLDGQYRTVHRKTYGLEKVRPLLDLRALISIPWTTFRYKARPDVWSAYDFGSIPALWISKTLFGGKLVMVLNNQPVLYSQTRKFGKLKGVYSWMMERVGARLVDHMFTINGTMKEYILNLGVSEENITVFSMNTIDRDKDFIKKAERGKIRRQYNISADTKVLLTVARLEAEKNYPRLLELVAGMGKGYVLIALGRGSLLEDLKAKAHALGVGDRVFFPGYVHRNEIWNYYKDADAFVLLSKAEALGVVLWEAMYMDVPVVSSDVEGIMETVGGDMVRARVWRESDGQAGFTERVRFCTEKSIERDLMIERAKRFVEEQLQNKVSINTLPILSE